MITVKTVYTGELRTQATHVRSGVTIITDAPTDNEGRGEAFSPTDLLAGSLGSCMLTIMGIQARKRGINIDGTKAEITKVMASGPRRVSEIVVELHVHGSTLNDEDKKVLENAALNCPVARSIHPDIAQKVTFRYSAESRLVE